MTKGNERPLIFAIFILVFQRDNIFLPGLILKSRNLSGDSGLERVSDRTMRPGNPTGIAWGTRIRVPVRATG